MAAQTTQQKISINVRNYVIDDRGLANTSAIEPKMYLQESPRTGFSAYDQKVNGGLAMIGFLCCDSFGNSDRT